MLVSLIERDAPALGDFGLVRAEPLSAFAAALWEAGLAVDCREVLAQDVVDSSWAKRLGIPSRRPAWILVATRS